MPKVSILVAVYQAEAFLSQCLDSLKNQSLDDFEAICVDDGSTDGSLRILQRYASEDARIKVIRLDENKGQAHARNVALAQAQGDYICMLDADDWLSEDALEQAVNAFDEQTDCMLFDVVYHWTDGREEMYQMPDFEMLTGEEAFRLSLTWQIHGLYMVRSALHRQYPYDDSCRAYSDDNTTRIHYLYARQVRRCKGRYYYRQHPKSVTHGVSVRRFDYLKANEQMRRMMVEAHVSTTMIDAYENARWLNLIDVCMFLHVHGSELSAEERKYGLKEIQHAWATINRRALKKETIAKFGYRPCGLWWMFRLQEWLYFTLRGFLGKNH